MKKRTVLSLAAMISVVFFAGCNKKEKKKAETPLKAAEPITLKVWESDKGPDQFIQQAGDAFTKTHPNITVQYVHVELGDATGQIALDGPAGIGPDLFAASSR